MSKAIELMKGLINVPVLLNNNKYYQTSEAAEIAGVSRSTLIRWIKGGVLKDASHRDRRGWRLMENIVSFNFKDLPK